MDAGVRAQILELLAKGTPTEEIARELDLPRGTVAATKAHLTRGRYAGSPAGPSSVSAADVKEIEDAADIKQDMQEALRQNIGQLDPALQIVDEGKERRVEAGLIDTLAEDRAGARVVIYRLRDGRLARLEMFFSREQALKAAGLRE
jgi:Homeodomain-like domain-containing protein